ncbi:MAG: ABC transporter ATP-binding protein [Deltaproteobacteria bacterium]|nr:ABC transporter ATP-binding protein [Deltaproteobacteria bacterium]
MDNILEIRGLSKTFRAGFWLRKVRALRDVSLTVRENEIYGFLGPNGAGKTTTIKTILGLIFPDSGKITIMGKDYRDISTRRYIGYAPEQPYFYEYLTAYEFMKFYGSLFSIPSSELKRRIPMLLDMVGLGGKESLQLRKFSKGMLQRIGLAQALINDPKFLILDEPMSGLDPIGRREIRDLILALKKSGKTVFFSTHILSDVEMICDKVAIIIEGEIRKEASLSELLSIDYNEVEVVFKGGNKSIKDDLKKIGLLMKDIDDTCYMLVSKSDISKTVDVIRLGGGDILSIIPKRRTLEDIFIKEINC